MTILVTSVGKGRSKKFTISVMDGNNTLCTETAVGVAQRDKVLWKLAELYDVLDIEMKEGKEDFKFSEIPSIPVLEESEAADFFEENKDFVYNRILQAVDEGLRSGRDVIRLFELNGTGVYMTSNKADWKEGIQQALDYFISVEQYTNCTIAKQIMQQL